MLSNHVFTQGLLCGGWNTLKTMCRNGTPRQPQLVPGARARIEFDSNIQTCSFEDLNGFSHVWIVYVFHKNTNQHYRLNRTKFKAKVQVPRLNGKRISVFATRTPHRYNNIGLSVARVIEVLACTVTRYNALSDDGGLGH